MNIFPSNQLREMPEQSHLGGSRFSFEVSNQKRNVMECIDKLDISLMFYLFLYNNWERLIIHPPWTSACCINCVCIFPPAVTFDAVVRQQYSAFQWISTQAWPCEDPEILESQVNIYIYTCNICNLCNICNINILIYIVITDINIYLIYIYYRY